MIAPVEPTTAAAGSAYARLLEQVNRNHDLGKALSLLSWDRELNMPRAGDMARVQQMTTLRQLGHRFSTSDEFGAAIEAAAAETAGLAADSDEASLIRVLRRDYRRARCLPEPLVVELSRVGAEAWRVWKQAREDNDFPRFQPHLQRLVELQREMADLYGYEGEAYDALLDNYEEGALTAEVRAVFDIVKTRTVPLLQAIVERGSTVDDGLLHQSFATDRQEAFARMAAEFVGYDFDRGHLGTAVHPFATSFSRDDARITTRWQQDFLSPALFGTLHECGHAIYEQGTHPSLARTPLARGTSSGIHESQSRLFENLIGRSRDFWRAHYGRLQSHFPEQLGGFSAEDFYRAINRVQASFIRVEADELTYNLHIILRFELEQAMLSGDLATADLPAAWNDGMERLLGVRPPDDREGCLQDVHWSGPSFGYFPTYALGNLYAAQIYETALERDPRIAADLEEGGTKALREWLGSQVHQHGRKFRPDELIVRVSGRPLDPEPFLRYVTRKFSDLYGLA